MSEPEGQLQVPDFHKNSGPPPYLSSCVVYACLVVFVDL
jgi:hypothetical protein